MNFQSKLITIALLTTVLGGCATITKDATQQVKVETYTKDNQAVMGAKCTAKNERGQWSTNSPNSFPIHRSGDNLLINCEKDGQPSGIATVISRVNGGMFGNIIFGGGIGAIIDHNKGTAYSYPEWIRVIMGDNLVFDRRNNKDNEVMIGQSATPGELKKIEVAKAAEEKAAREKAAQEKSAANTATSNK